MSQPNAAAPAKEKFTSYQILLMTLLALTQFTVVLDFMVMSPLGDVLKKSMQLTPQQFGFVVAGYALSAGVSGLLTAGFADSFDRKRLLLFFYVGFIGGTLFCGLSHTYELLLTARIITGIFGGVIGAISMAIVTDVFPIQQRGRVMGFMQMGFGASQVLGIPISLYISNHWGWQSPFLMIVGLASIIWLSIMIKMQPITQHLELQKAHNAGEHLFNTIKSRRYRIGFTTTALLSLGGFMMMPWGSVFSINNLHVTKEQLPLLFMVGGVATLFIMPMIGKIADKTDKMKIFTIASLWMIAVVCVYTNLTPVPLWVVMIMNVMMMGGIMGRMVPSMALVSALPQMQDRGAFMSINSSLQQIAGGIAAALGGLIVYQKDEFSPIQHYNYLGYLVSAISLICIFMLYRVNKIVKEETN
jgi:predicted MFS family arabinose efflux permease